MTGSLRHQLLSALVASAVLLTLACGGGTGAAPSKPATAAGGATTAPAGSGPAAAGQPGASCSQDRTYRFAYLQLGWAATEIIHQEKLLEKRGWKIDWQTVGPISGLVNAFASGQADLIDMSVIIAGQMHESGVPLKIFGTAVGVLGAVVVPTNHPARELPDLRGKKVGVIPGGTTTQDINASSRVVYGFDVLTDTQAITATAPPDLAALLRKGDVEAILIWEPVTSALIKTGEYRILVHQQELWERASGSSILPVHVAYLAKPELAEQCPNLLADINDAQREAYEIWQNQPEVAQRAIVEVTKLTPDEAAFAMSQTKQVLYGLTEAQIDTMLAQLRHNREHGTLLKSDVWYNPEQLKQQLFFIPPARR
ncbi:MAG: transporter substrate-binding domain-containing protein [Chloroflexi bacterium]|nr:transporter substrate-binding domain-containing protein [Chloroflexota bacterium]